MKRLLFCLAAMLAVIFMAGVCSADTLDFDPVEPVEWAVTIDGQQGFDNCETLSEGVFYQMFRDTAVDGWRKFIPEKTGTYHFYVRQPSADNGGWYTAGRFSIQICDRYGTPISGWRVEGNYNNVRVPEVYRYDLEAGRTYYFVATNQYGHWVRTDAYFAICSPTRHIGELSDEAVIQEPTCTEPGYKAQRCLLCGGEVNITEIPAMGHTPGEEVTIKAASPDEADETYTCCLVCGEMITNETGNAPDAGGGIAGEAGTVPDAGESAADSSVFEPVEPVELAVTIGGQQGFDNCETLSEGVFYQMFRDTAVDGWRKFIPEKTGTYHFYVRQPSADNGNWYTAGRFSIQICDQYGTPISGWRVEGNYNNVRVPEVYRYDLEAGRTYYFVATNQYGHWVRTDAYFAICSPTRHIGGLSDEVVIQEPTCTEPGYKAQRCLLCGGETNITEIPAMGHTPGEQVTIKAASPDEADETYTRCVVCGEFLTDEAGNAPDAGESANP